MTVDDTVHDSINLAFYANDGENFHSPSFFNHGYSVKGIFKEKKFRVNTPHDHKLACDPNPAA